MAMEFLSDKSLYDIGDNDLKELWDSDFDSPMSEAFTGEQDWTHLLDNQPVILNDRMITDAVQSPRITSEHSYSLVTNDDMSPGSPSSLHRLEDFGKSALDNDLESECFPAIPMNTASGSPTEIFIKQEPLSAPSSPQPVTCSSQRTLTSQSILKQPPTIILASRPTCQSNSNRCLLLSPKVKVEPMHTGFSLPPTPPSSTSSDSEGSLSPVHSHQPSSPSVAANSISVSSTSSKRSGSISQRNPSSTPLISSQPKGATGVLILTEEEKRTLLAEGYPIPSRLPLTKSEEKSLKKIRRKIKNKISAQESRRKKKEYMDALEKKVEALNNENSEYKKKLDSLENNNKSLLCQLQKLQTMLGDVPNRLSRNISTQTTTSVMVLVLCFTMFLGSWGPFGNFFISPAKWSLPLQHSSLQDHRASFLSDVPRDPYLTHNKPSRTLLGVKDDLLEGIDHSKMENGKDPNADHSLASDISQTLNHLLFISDDHVQSSVQSLPLPPNEETKWISSDRKKSSSSLSSTSPLHSPDMVTSVNATHLVAVNASEKQALKATA